MINSELTTTTCSIYYNAKKGDKIMNLYTGYYANDSEVSGEYCLKNTITSMLDIM
jgi:hypothetical protein